MSLSYKLLQYFRRDKRAELRMEEGRSRDLASDHAQPMASQIPCIFRSVFFFSPPRYVSLAYDDRHLFSTAGPEPPSSLSEESRAAQYWRQEGINNQPITGNYKPKNADRYKPTRDDDDDGD